MGFIQLWHDNTALSKILCSTIPVQVHDLKIKVTDFEFFGVKSLQCQLLQSLWLIWVVFGMTGYKILKCFRKEKRISGELPCPATSLITPFDPAHEIIYLPHRRPAKRLLFAHMTYGSRLRVQPKIRHLAPLDGSACAFEEWVYGGRKVR